MINLNEDNRKLLLLYKNLSNKNMNNKYSCSPKIKNNNSKNKSLIIFSTSSFKIDGTNKNKGKNSDKIPIKTINKTKPLKQRLYLMDNDIFKFLDNKTSKNEKNINKVKNSKSTKTEYTKTSPNQNYANQRIKDKVIYTKKILKKEKYNSNNHHSNNNIKKTPNINLIIRYKTIKFNLILTSKDDNSIKLSEKINTCLNLSLNEFQIKNLAEQISTEINNIIKNIIKRPMIYNYSSIIDLNKILFNNDLINMDNNDYYKITAIMKNKNKKYNFITKENEKNIELISDNILTDINDNNKYRENVLKDEIILNIKKSIQLKKKEKNNLSLNIAP
jgi:hypothetical protein